MKSVCGSDGRKKEIGRCLSVVFSKSEMSWMKSGKLDILFFLRLVVQEGEYYAYNMIEE